MWLKFHFNDIVSLTPSFPKSFRCLRCISIPSCLLYVRIIIDSITLIIFGEDYRWQYSSLWNFFIHLLLLGRQQALQDTGSAVWNSGTQVSCQWQQRCHAGCCRPWAVVFKPWVSPRYLVAWLRADFSREALRPFLTTWD